MATSGSHGGEFHPAGPAHNLDYEPDVGASAVKTILAVPIAVLVTGVIAFAITWSLFNYIFDPKIQEPAENQAAADRNNAPLNDRMARISSTDPNAEVQQPRLEGMRQTEVLEREGYQITAEMTVTRPKKDGNPPQYHADDLRPERSKELSTAGGGKITIDQAIAELVNRRLLPARQGALPLDIDAPWNRPKESNGGSARLPEPAKPNELKKEPEKK